MTTKFSTVQDVLTRMKQTLSLLEVQPRYAAGIPFLYTYFLVTQRVMRAEEEEKLFQHPEALHQLDIYFAQQYFHPLDQFVAGSIQQLSPWETYFQYFQVDKPRAFLLTLLGINAHINGDLPVALAMTKYDKEQDFQQIDQLLSSVISQLMKFLAKKYHDVQAIGGVLMPGFTQQEFSRIIIQWRHQAWENSLKIDPEHFESQRSSLNAQTELVAKQLIALFHDPVYSVFHQSQWHQMKVVL